MVGLVNILTANLQVKWKRELCSPLTLPIEIKEFSISFQYKNKYEISNDVGRITFCHEWNG